MRVLMLGWEFPPFISGGLGTACHGLTRALSRRDVDVLFVLPRDPGAEHATHVTLMAASGQRISSPQGSETVFDDPAMAHVQVKALPSKMVSPYQSTGGQLHAGGVAGDGNGESLAVLGINGQSAAGPHYAGDLIAETRHYAQLCVRLARDEQFDVIHAHDWMTYPAGLAVAAATGKPLVVHVHSTEFDRSGDNVNQQVYDIERRGVHGACRVVTVSYLTKSITQHRYGVGADKIDVIYNGIEYNGQCNGNAYQPRTGIKRGEKIVLFLGRITMQKGPEYFVGAAKKVLEKFDNVKFVMAGTGDKVADVIELAAKEGIGHKVLFTGFLRGADVQRVFEMADVYVMPSVSEPFGIAPLEAISHDVPVIISKTSGVAEILTHALKVDFWDTHDIADKILAVLRHPPLSSTLREQADLEVRGITWDGAAAKCLQTYQSAMQMVYAA